MSLEAAQNLPLKAEQPYWMQTAKTKQAKSAFWKERGEKEKDEAFTLAAVYHLWIQFNQTPKNLGDVILMQNLSLN